MIIEIEHQVILAFSVVLQRLWQRMYLPIEVEETYSPVSHYEKD